MRITKIPMGWCKWQEKSRFVHFAHDQLVERAALTRVDSVVVRERAGLM